MKNKTNRTIIISSLLCLAPIILALFLYDDLPAQIPVHFNGTGNPDGYLPKFWAAFGLPFFFAILDLFVNFMITNDPKKENSSRALRQIMIWIIPILSIIAIPFSLFISIGVKIPIGKIILLIVGIIIVICGNYLPKCKRNYTIGIKLPWTLADDDIWNKTHRFAGFLWVICGFLLIINAFLTSSYFSLAIIILLIVPPVVYSYLIYRKNNNDNQK